MVKLTLFTEMIKTIFQWGIGVADHHFYAVLTAAVYAFLSWASDDTAVHLSRAALRLIGWIIELVLGGLHPLKYLLAHILS